MINEKYKNIIDVQLDIPVCIAWHILKKEIILKI